MTIRLRRETTQLHKIITILFPGGPSKPAFGINTSDEQMLVLSLQTSSCGPLVTAALKREGSAILEFPASLVIELKKAQQAASLLPKSFDLQTEQINFYLARL